MQRRRRSLTAGVCKRWHKKKRKLSIAHRVDRCTFLGGSVKRLFSSREIDRYILANELSPVSPSHLLVGTASELVWLMMKQEKKEKSDQIESLTFSSCAEPTRMMSESCTIVEQSIATMSHHTRLGEFACGAIKNILSIGVDWHDLWQGFFF